MKKNLFTSPVKNAISSTSENVVNCGRLVVDSVWKLFNKSSKEDVEAILGAVFNVVGSFVVDFVVDFI